MKRNLSIATLAVLLAGPVSAQADIATSAVSGIPNFHQVTEHIFRGAQPADQGWSELAKLGVTTVIDLRRPVEHSINAESTAVCRAGMCYVNFPMNGFDTPTAEQMTGVLAMLDRPGGVFIHCKQGRDRTGTVVATYRIARQHWEPAKALAEAESLGLHWYERGMKRFIAGYRALPSPAAPPSALAAGTPSLPDSAAAQLSGR